MATVIVLTGPTASGKSRLAMELAQKWDGEIVCADSRTVYKGMDIGTAKPTKTEQESVRHWLLDVVEPGQRFTAADFQKLAREAIVDIHARGKIPFLVGGTGLYIDSIVLNFVFGSDADTALRHKLEKLTVDQLQTLLTEQHIELPENAKNKRYLIRRIENYNRITPVEGSINDGIYVFAITTERDELRRRIRDRIEHMFSHKIVQETQHLLQLYGPENEAMTGNIYRVVARMIKGEIDEPTAKTLCATRDWRLAKRQITWIKRHDYVQWRSLDEARVEIESILRKYRDA